MIRIDLARVSRLGEGVQIGEVQARVSARESDVGTRVMVRHGLFLLSMVAPPHKKGDS